MLEMVVRKGLKVLAWQSLVGDHGSQLFKFRVDKKLKGQEWMDHLSGIGAIRIYDESSARENIGMS